MKIYLVGFMGAGKTSVGRALASSLSWPFFDLDELIEGSEGLAVKEIFSSFGEPHFRKREREILQTTKHLEYGVIATGGGTFTFEENLMFVRSEGFSIFLNPPFALLARRAEEKKEERPMFRDEMQARELYQQRLRSYKMADLTLDVREEDTVAELVARLLLDLPRDVFDARGATIPRIRL